ENDDKVKKGNIISQSPKNKSVDEGSIINLTVSKGKSGEDDDDSDDSDVKSTSETVKVPYSGSKGKSQTVEVFIRDKDNSGNSASQTFKITKDKTISIPLKIEKGKTAGYTVRVDNKIVADKDVGYDD
ncbi:PASTA domain-containing protein, partial [Staphylococcus epidermidis]